MGPNPNTQPAAASDPEQQQKEAPPSSAGPATVHNVITRFEARDGSGLKGRAVLRGSCAADPEHPQRLQVKNVVLLTIGQTGEGKRGFV